MFDALSQDYPGPLEPVSLPQPSASAEPIKLVHLAVAEDGGVRFLTGRKLPDGVESCELYAMPDYGRAPAELFASPVIEHRYTIDQALVDSLGGPDAFLDAVAKGRALVAQASGQDAEMVSLGGTAPPVPRWLLDAAQRIAQYMDAHSPGDWAIGGIQKRQASGQAAPSDMAAINGIIARHFPDDPANAVRAQSAALEVLSRYGQAPAASAEPIPKAIARTIHRALVAFSDAELARLRNLQTPEKSASNLYGAGRLAAQQNIDDVDAALNWLAAPVAAQAPQQGEA